MAHFTSTEIKAMDHLYKINLINSCSGYKSANLIGTKSKEGIPNVAVFSSVTHLGSNPPLLSFVLRPTTVPRNTYDNIKQTGTFTINHVHKSIVKDAHHSSAKYDASISEFEATELEEIYLNNFHAPFVKDAPVQIGLNYLEEHHIKVNGTILIIGEIVSLHVRDSLLKDDGFINLSEGNVAAINGLDSYAIPRLYKRLSYQRPKASFLNRNETQ